jgi:predicted MPP superfamily phosphohydrolase
VETLRWSIKSRAARIALVAVVCLAIVAVWGFWWEPSSLTVVHRTLDIQPWHAEHNGLKVAVISDLHIGSPYWGIGSLKKVINATNAEHPDLILLLGDYVIEGVKGGHFVAPETIADHLTSLRSRLGVIAVLGNHDWWFDGQRVRRALESRGIRVLDNEALRVTDRGQAFWLCGVQDLWMRGDGVAATLSKVSDGEPVLVMTHNPDVFPNIPASVSLTLAGHTHGGQVNLPIVGRPIVPSMFKQRYAYGLIEEKGRKLYVTSGVGTSIIPVRIGVRPEVVILTLNAK